MNDMTLTVVPKSDQINADDLIGGPRTITITRMAIDPTSEQPVSVYFEGDNGKPYKACKSMRRVMIHAWGPDASKYAGQSMTLYRDADVMFGGMKVGGIRISHLSGIDKPLTMALTATKAKRALFTVRPLTVAKPEPEKPAEPPTMDNAQTQTGFNDAFEAALKAADGATAVEAVLAHPKVQKAQAAFKGAQAERLAALIQSALARTAPPAEEPPADAGDGWPGPVTGEAA
jgi:hypothetical protein